MGMKGWAWFHGKRSNVHTCELTCPLLAPLPLLLPHVVISDSFLF